MNLQDLQAELRQDPAYRQAEKDLRFNFRLSNAVLYARMAKGWSQTELAKRVNTKQANISRIEASLANPTLDLIRRLCDVLEIELAFCGPEITASSQQANTITAVVRVEPNVFENENQVVYFSASSILDQKVQS